MRTASHVASARSRSVAAVRLLLYGHQNTLLFTLKNFLVRILMRVPSYEESTPTWAAAPRPARTGDRRYAARTCVHRSSSCHLHPWGMLCILLPGQQRAAEEVATHPVLRPHVFALRSLASGLIHCLFQLFMWGIRRDSSRRTLHSRGPAAVIRSLSLHRIMFLLAQRTLADLHHGV